MEKKIIGKIAQIIGPVADVVFEQEKYMPDIYDALEVTRENGEKVVLECQQDIGECTMRTIAMDSTDGLRRGMEAVSLAAIQYQCQQETKLKDACLM